MNKIEVAVIDQPYNPGRMEMFLAKLTQRGHSINDMKSLVELQKSSATFNQNTLKTINALPHSTIKRFTPTTVAIVGASRRFLAQARTHQVGMTYVSASLQYSDYSDGYDFVVPYRLLGNFPRTVEAREAFLASCNNSMDTYSYLIDEFGIDNDTCGYAAPQALRNILIIQGNHESWRHFINLRACNRNTDETKYVTLRIWEELIKTQDGEILYENAGPDCMHGHCREGKMSCRVGMQTGTNPTYLINKLFPNVREE